LKLLSDEATEHLQSSLAILLGKSFPEPIQSEPPTPSRSRRKKVPSSLRSMVPLLEGRCDNLDTNRPASKKQKPIVSEIQVRVDAGQPRGYCLCSFCNGYKGPCIAGHDPRTGKLTPLFNLRRHKWTHHFRYQGGELIGRTAIGRTTIEVLQINLPNRVALRELLMEDGLF
jgi:hypothetical protein